MIVIFATPAIEGTLDQQLRELDELCNQLNRRAGGAGPWLGALRRQWRAASAASSIEIEGFHVTTAEAIEAASGRQPANPTDDDRMALSDYTRAIDHVGVMASEASFHWVDRVVLDLHFDACHFQKDKRPGRYRSGPIGVTSPQGGPPSYVGPPHEQVASLMAEVLSWLQRGDLDAHVVVRAAMAHLHIVSVHPFADGNGRISRIVQSLVLARGGLLAPELLSIEEYLGQHTEIYYAALRQVQGGSYQPERDATPWIRFCVNAHLEQARRRLEQLAQAGRRWALLEQLVERRGWPDRLIVALEQSLFEGVDRASYAAEAEISLASASNDLRRLLDAGLVVRHGQGRTTRYVGSDVLKRQSSPAIDELDA